MRSNVTKAGWAALLVLASGALNAARAEDGGAPALSPPGPRVDYTPTGALRPQPLPVSSVGRVSRLDLTTPAGLTLDLPPEAPPPAFTPPSAEGASAPAPADPLTSGIQAELDRFLQVACGASYRRRRLGGRAQGDRRRVR